MSAVSQKSWLRALLSGTDLNAVCPRVSQAEEQAEEWAWEEGGEVAAPPRCAVSWRGLRRGGLPLCPLHHPVQHPWGGRRADLLGDRTRQPLRSFQMGAPGVLSLLLTWAA